MDKTHIQSALNRTLKLINGLLVSASIYFFACLTEEVIGAGSGEIFGIPVSKGNAIFVLAFCTLAHIVLLRYLIYYIHLAWMNLNQSERLECYYQLTGSNHLITQGSERLKDKLVGGSDFLYLQVREDDPPAVLHWGAFVLAIAAVTRFEVSMSLVWSFFAGLLLAMANWQIGSCWLVAIADLGRDCNKSLYFREGRGFGFRYFGVLSGPWWGARTNIFSFSALILVDSIVRIFPLIVCWTLLWIILEFVLGLF